jgi:hypothetical protein
MLQTLQWVPSNHGSENSNGPSLMKSPSDDRSRPPPEEIILSSKNQSRFHQTRQIAAKNRRTSTYILSNDNPIEGLDAEADMGTICAGELQAIEATEVWVPNSTSLKSKSALQL